MTSSNSPATGAGRSASAARHSGQVPRQPSRFLLGMAAVYGVASLVVLVSWSLFGDAWWLQPLNLTMVWWPLPAFALALVAIGTRHWRALAWVLVPILGWTWIYGTAWVPPTNVDVAAPADLRVVAWNMYVGTPDASHVTEMVDRVDPDVVLLMEVFPARQEELETELGDSLPYTAAVQSEGVGGVMVASRYPIADVREVPAVEGARSSLVAVVDVDGTDLQVVPVHLRSPCLECGDSLTQRLSLEGSTRAAEMAAVLGALEPGMPTIVGGDLNSNERSLPYRELTGAGFDDPQRSVGQGPGFTWPAGGDRMPFPMVRIDWLLSRGLEPVAAWVEPAGPSDHHPVVATFTFQEAS